MNRNSERILHGLPRRILNNFELLLISGTQFAGAGQNTQTMDDQLCTACIPKGCREGNRHMADALKRAKITLKEMHHGNDDICTLVELVLISIYMQFV
jgi:hypothetical protein